MTTGARRAAVWVGLAGLVISALFLLRFLATTGWDPTVFLSVGEESGATRAYVEDQLGEVDLRPAQGHDGKYFFVLANDPWILSPSENAAVFDRPLYRSQRMLYPVIAGAGGLLPPAAIVWSLLVVNVMAMGLGSWAVARIAQEMGGSPWIGLAFVLNLGFISEMAIDGAGIVAAALAFLALLMVMRSKVVFGYVLLALAALTREAMLIVAAGTAFWLWRDGRRREAGLSLLFPLGSVVLWAAYLRLRLGFETGADQVIEIGPPFLGLTRAFQNWLGDPLDLATGLAMVILIILFGLRALRSRHLVGWANLGFVVLGVLFTELVWSSWFDISRALAPAVTAYVVLFLVDRQLSRRGTVDDAAIDEPVGV